MIIIPAMSLNVALEPRQLDDQMHSLSLCLWSDYSYATAGSALTSQLETEINFSL